MEDFHRFLSDSRPAVKLAQAARNLFDPSQAAIIKGQDLFWRVFPHCSLWKTQLPQFSLMLFSVLCKDVGVCVGRPGLGAQAGLDFTAGAVWEGPGQAGPLLCQLEYFKVMEVFVWNQVIIQAAARGSPPRPDTQQLPDASTVGDKMRRGAGRFTASLSVKRFTCWGYYQQCSRSCLTAQRSCFQAKTQRDPRPGGPLSLGLLDYKVIPGFFFSYPIMGVNLSSPSFSEPCDPV